MLGDKLVDIIIYILYNISMFARTVTVFETVPEKKGIVGKIKFFLMNRRIQEVAKEFEVTLGDEFYQELSKWTGKLALIVFSKKDDLPVKWKIESKGEHFGRMRERADTLGVASDHLD